MADKDLSFLPVLLRISDKNILVVGGGKVALHKVKIILRFTGNITVVSPEFTEGFDNTGVRLVRKCFSDGDLALFDLVYICTGDRELNSRIKALCESRLIPASVCDDPAQCDFISPAVCKYRNITISVGSDGREVKRSIRIRDRINRLIEEGLLLLD